MLRILVVLLFPMSVFAGSPAEEAKDKFLAKYNAYASNIYATCQFYEQDETEPSDYSIQMSGDSFSGIHPTHKFGCKSSYSTSALIMAAIFDAETIRLVKDSGLADYQETSSRTGITLRGILRGSNLGCNSEEGCWVSEPVRLKINSILEQI